MKLRLVISLLTLLTISNAAASDKHVTITGTWEGESKCKVPDSPCHDEHVIYEVKSDPQAASQFSIDAYKVVSGKRDFMGTLGCRYPMEDGTLRCTGHRPTDIWTFTVSADRMSGTLHVGDERQLFRTVEVTLAK
jgi:hypothetical protein